MFSYVIILAFVLLITPFVLKLASKQGKKTKQQLKTIFLFLLVAQIILGFLNWENFTDTGRSGFELAFIYPNSLLGLFFVTAILQAIFLIVSKFLNLNTVVVLLNFINSILIFVGMVRLSSFLGFQAVSFASLTTVFLVLTGNVVALAFVNRDENILKKYFGG